MDNEAIASSYAQSIGKVATLRVIRRRGVRIAQTECKEDAARQVVGKEASLLPVAG